MVETRKYYIDYIVTRPAAFLKSFTGCTSDARRQMYACVFLVLPQAINGRFKYNLNRFNGRGDHILTC